MGEMDAKYPGVCVSGGDEIAIGERIVWAPGQGARHMECPATPTLRTRGGCRPGHHVLPEGGRIIGRYSGSGDYETCECGYVWRVD